MQYVNSFINLFSTQGLKIKTYVITFKENSQTQAFAWLLTIVIYNYTIFKEKRKKRRNFYRFDLGREAAKVDFFLKRRNLRCLRPQELGKKTYHFTKFSQMNILLGLGTKDFFDLKKVDFKQFNEFQRNLSFVIPEKRI